MSIILAGTDGTPSLASPGVALLDQITAVLAPAIQISPVGTQPPNTNIAIAGTLLNYVTIPTLTYTINGGAPIAIGSPTLTAFAFTIVGGLTAGNYTVVVSDGTRSVPTSFSVSAGKVLVLGTIAPVTVGNGVILSGATAGYGAQPGAFNVSFNGGISFPLMGLSNSPVGSAFNIALTVAQVPAIGTYQVVVQDTATPAVISGAQTMTVSSASVSTPASIPGVASWWDAGTTAGLLSPGGGPAAGWSQPVGALLDKAGASNLTASTTAQGVPRLVPPLGGVGLTTLLNATTFTPAMWPVMDTSLYWSAPVAFGAGGEVTFYLVWSRPNLPQNLVSPLRVQYYTGATVPLLTLGAVPVLTMTSNGTGSDRLTLFPGTASQTVLSNQIEQRHTHSAIVRVQAGVGVDVWLDGTKVTLTPAATQLGTPASLTALLLGNAVGSAQCWLHEAATYARSLSDADISTLLNAALRWPRGKRAGASVIALGQSNAIDAQQQCTNWYDICKGVCYTTGMLSFSIIGSNKIVADQTLHGAQGMAGTSSYYLIDDGSGNPAQFVQGNLGISTQAYFQALAAFDQASVMGFFAIYSEQDSLGGYGPAVIGSFLKNTGIRWQQLLFGYIGKAANAAALFWISALPEVSSIPSGLNAYREMVSDFTATPATSGVYTMLPNTCASDFGNGGGHLGTTSNISMMYLAYSLIASTAIALGYADAGAVMPAGYPTKGGPAVTTAAYEGTAHAATGTVLITVQHDAGTDLIVPGTAANGVGWLWIDNHTSLPTSGGVTQVAAIGCARVNATQLRVTLASIPAHTAAGQSMIYYMAGPNAGGNGQPGLGNVITDNWSTIVLASDIGADLGPVWRPNMLLAATARGVVVN